MSNRLMVAIAVLIFMLGPAAPAARADWDVEVMGDIGGSLGGAGNKQFDDFYQSVFTLSSGASSSVFAFIPLGFDVWLHYAGFGVGFYGSLELNGPGSTMSGTYTRDPGYYSYWYDDGTYWYYYSYYDPGGTYDYSYGISLDQGEKAVMFEYRLPIMDSLSHPSGKKDEGGGLALMFGLGTVSVHGSIFNSDDGEPNGDFTYGFTGSGPLYIYGLDFEGFQSPWGLGVSLQYRDAKIPKLTYDSGRVVRDQKGDELQLDYSGVFLTLSLGLGFGDSTKASWGSSSDSSRAPAEPAPVAATRAPAGEPPALTTAVPTQVLALASAFRPAPRSSASRP